MKIIVSTFGRFHAFNLSSQLQKNDYLKLLFTQDLLRKADKNIKNKIQGSFILRTLRLFQYAFIFLPRLRKYEENIQEYLMIKHDLFVSNKIRKIKDVDFFIGLSGNSINSIKTAKENNMITIVDHGLSHPIKRKKILEEEYSMLNIKYVDKKNDKIIERMLKEFESADYIFLGSTYAKKSFIEQGVDEKKIRVIPYGVDLTRFHKVEKTDKVFRVVYCGGISAEKGVHYLIDGFKEIKIENKELLLIGPASNTIKIDKADKSIKYIGPIKQQELYKYLSQGSIFVFPSLDDGFGMVMIEAMACGLPVIATSSSGGQDIIKDGDNGFVVAIRDKEALKEKIGFFYNNPEKLLKMSDNALNTSKEFSWENYGKKVILELEKIKNRS